MIHGLQPESVTEREAARPPDATCPLCHTTGNVRERRRTCCRCRLGMPDLQFAVGCSAVSDCRRIRTLGAPARYREQAHDSCLMQLKIEGVEAFRSIRHGRRDGDYRQRLTPMCSLLHGGLYGEGTRRRAHAATQGVQGCARQRYGGVAIKDYEELGEAIKTEQKLFKQLRVVDPHLRVSRKR